MTKALKALIMADDNLRQIELAFEDTHSPEGDLICQGIQMGRREIQTALELMKEEKVHEE